MLILTRKSNEAIKIGDDITITVIDIRGNQVRIGIEAPIDVRVHRKEIYEKIKIENLVAAQTKLEEFLKIKEELLKNHDFIKNAPSEVIKQEKEKLEQLKERRRILEGLIGGIKSK